MPSTEWKKYINTKVTSVNADEIASAISKVSIEQDEKENSPLGEVCLNLGIYLATEDENYIKALEFLTFAKSFLTPQKIQFDWSIGYIAYCAIHMGNNAMGLHYSEEIIKKYSPINQMDKEIVRLTALGYFARAFSSISPSKIIADFISAIELYENMAVSDSNILDTLYADIKLNYANYLTRLDSSIFKAIDFVELYKNKKNNYEELNSTTHENPAMLFEKLEKNYWSTKETSHSYHAEKFYFYYGEYLYNKSQSSSNSNAKLDLAAAFLQFEKAKTIDDNLKEYRGKESKLSLSIQNKTVELKRKLKNNVASKQHSRSLTFSKEPLGFLINRNRSNSVTSYGSCDTTPREHKQDAPSTSISGFNPFKNY